VQTAPTLPNPIARSLARANPALERQDLPSTTLSDVTHKAHNPKVAGSNPAPAIPADRTVETRKGPAGKPTETSRAVRKGGPRRAVICACGHQLGINNARYL
jgi:hypothetical protein